MKTEAEKAQYFERIREVMREQLSPEGKKRLRAARMRRDEEGHYACTGGADEFCREIRAKIKSDEDPDAQEEGL